MTTHKTFLTVPIFSHVSTCAHFKDTALIGAMVKTEIALARAQAALGILTEAAASEIAALHVPLQASEVLDAGVAATDVPIPALLDILRNQLTTEAADALHYGATSQDIVDTALCICIGSALNDLARTVFSLINTLQAVSEAHADTLMLARTRGQLATQITFGLRIAQWVQPHIALEGELDALRGAVRTLLENLIVDADSMCARATSDTSVLAEAAAFCAGPQSRPHRRRTHPVAGAYFWGPLRDAFASHGDIDGNTALSDTVFTPPAARVATEIFAQRKAEKTDG